MREALKKDESERRREIKRQKDEAENKSFCVSNDQRRASEENMREAFHYTQIHQLIGRDSSPRFTCDHHCFFHRSLQVYRVTAVSFTLTRREAQQHGSTAASKVCEEKHKVPQVYFFFAHLHVSFLLTRRFHCQM